MSKKIRIAFWGSPVISALLLQLLYNCSDFEIIFVVTQPDKARSSRGQKTLPTPVKKFAQENNLPVLAPSSLKKEKESILQLLKEKQVDFQVVLAYGKIISQEIFDFTSLGTVNFHASLLPLLRGAAPIEFALFHGFNETGWTLQRINKRMDAGDIYFQSTVDIDFFDTRETLYDKLTKNLKTTAVSALRDYAHGRLIATKQNESQASYCQKISSTDARIDWQLSAEQLRNQARAFGNKNTLFAFYQANENTKAKRIKLFIDVHVKEKDFLKTQDSPGTITQINQHLWIAAGNQLAIPIHRVQLEGKKELDVQSFLNGHRLAEGDRLL